MKLSKYLLSIGMLAGVIFVVTLLIGFNIQQGVTPVVKEKGYKPIILDAVGDADPGEGASGVLSFYVNPHATAPTTTYNANLSSGWYAISTVNNTDAGYNVPYSTAFDIVIKVRWNVTHAWNGTGWDSTYTKAYVNCSALSISALAMNQQLIGSNSTYIWYNYWVNGTTGYTITKGQNVTSCSFNFEAYY